MEKNERATAPSTQPSTSFSDSILEIPLFLQNIPSVLTQDPADQHIPGADGLWRGKRGYPGCLNLCWNTQDESEHLCSFGHSCAHLVIRLRQDSVGGGGFSTSSP